MMQSYLWQMVHMRADDETILDIPEGYAGRGRGQALLAMHCRHHRIRRSDLSSC
jgi:hypothetical protein